MLKVFNGGWRGALVWFALVIGFDAQAAGRHSALSLPRAFVDASQLPGGAAGQARFVAQDGSVTLGRGTIALTPRGEGSRGGVTIRFAGANPDAAVEGREAMAATLHLFPGNDPANWRSLVQYQRVRMRAVYPGIDVEVYANGGDLEYDFLLAPGADPGRIRMRFEGGGRVRRTPCGDLEVRSRRGRMVQHRPAVYQVGGGERRRVTGEYVVAKGGETRFAIGPRDAAQGLVIDPVIAYATTFGAGVSPISGMVVDRSGMVYVAGATDVDVAGKGYGTAGAMFVARFDPTKSGAASLLYAAVFSGGVINALAADDNGNAYVAGRATGDFVPIVKGFQAHPAGRGFRSRPKPSAGG